jgi:hypothetical protein
MTDEPVNLTLCYLRSIDGKLDRVIERIDLSTARVSAAEKQVAATVTQMAEFFCVHGQLRPAV